MKHNNEGSKVVHKREGLVKLTHPERDMLQTRPSSFVILPYCRIAVLPYFNRLTFLGQKPSIFIFPYLVIRVHYAVFERHAVLPYCIIIFLPYI